LVDVYRAMGGGWLDIVDLQKMTEQTVEDGQAGNE
jgi:hypothetical protein